MLTATFCHAQGLGLASEQRLWDAGILSWEDALQTPSRLPLSESKKQLLVPALKDSQAALERQDSRWFQKNLPGATLWRGAKVFGESIAYVDIETDGGYDADSVTVIGLFDGFETRLYVKGQNLEDFVTAIKDYKLLVTFFGTSFDLPFLRRRFPELALDQLHIDLCPALRRLGQTGGLKAIEQRLGVRRVGDIEGMSGMDAVYLWALWERRRDEAALERLLAYNRADIENLKLLLEWAYPRLVADSGFPALLPPAPSSQ
ncbi:ribonuclease H-like domain-containing protein [Armatimonas sp.]|uniref:ribonuclease H-like domain-containing protein n=1 Tax=Armatimonas sp. TaxID=1872638 RepID=UPI00286CE337|nr:ribonuclease H-like domain-containing protein [Armatimonas sp.]